jgi:hypothetical protein
MNQVTRLNLYYHYYLLHKEMVDLFWEKINHFFIERDIYIYIYIFFFYFKKLVEIIFKISFIPSNTHQNHV